MKKSIKYLTVALLTLIFIILCMPKVLAKLMTAEDIKKISAFDNGEAYETVYVFGKHVYFNAFTMADAEEAAHTLVDPPNEFMYFKDGDNKWTRATTNAMVSSSDLKFEMIKLIGQKGENGYVSEYETLYNDSTYLGKRFQETLLDGRIADLFDDETTANRIASIRSLEKVRTIDGEPLSKASHIYNTSNLKVVFDNKKLELTEQKPLLKYSNSISLGLWFGLLVKTEKKITLEDISDGKIKLAIINPNMISPVLGTYHKYRIEICDIEDAPTFGGKENEFIIWLNGDNLKGKNENGVITPQNDSILEITDKSGNIIQRININYINSTNYFYFDNVLNEQPKIKNITNEVIAEILPLETEPQKFYVFFYGDEQIKKFEFTYNDKRYVAVYTGRGDYKGWEIVNEIPYLKLNAKLGKAVMLDGNRQNPNNDLFIDNMNNLELLSIDYKEETDTYTIYIRANDIINSFDGGQGKYKWFSLITDFGVNPKNLDSDQYSINDIDINDAERHGAENENQFVLWGKLDEFNNKTFTFTDIETRDTVNVKFEIQDVEKFDDPDLEDVSIDEVKPEEKRVKYRAEKKDYYIIDEGTTEFVAKVGGKDFNYKKDEQGVWHKSQKLVITKVLAGRDDLVEYTEKQKENQKAIQEVTFEGNTVNIKMAHKLHKFNVGNQNDAFSWYGLVIDLGIENSKIGIANGCDYTIETVDKKQANNHVGQENESLNNLVLWINTEQTNETEGKTIIFTNTDDPSIEYSITFKSTVEELKLNKVEKLDMTNISDSTDLNGDNMKKNNERFAIVKDEENTYEIAYQHPFIKYSNGYSNDNTECGWFGLLLNLGMNPKYFKGTNYTILPEDMNADKIARFGGESYDFIVWLSIEKFVDGKYSLTFENKYDSSNTITINFVLKNIDLQSAKMATPIDLEPASYTSYHVLNQGIYNINYFQTDGEKAIINIYPKPNALTPQKYNNGHGDKKWIAVLVDFGVDPNKLTSEQYTIERIDIIDAGRHGATSPTEFVMWIDAEEEREIEFKYAGSILKVKFAIECKDI